MNRRLWSVSVKELRAQLLVLLTVLWALAAINTFTEGARYRTGQIKGADFLHFYVFGSLAADGRGDLLYDVAAQRSVQEQLVPTSKGTWFVPIYGPQTALFFAAFAALPYLWAALAWAILTTVVYGVCVWAIWRLHPALQQWRVSVLLAAAAFPPFYSLVQHGQTSALPLLFFTLGYLALRADRQWLAGLALGAVIIKPQLGIAIAVVMLARRQWRIVGGAIIAIMAQWGVSVLFWGPDPLLEYFHMLGLSAALTGLLEPKPHQLHSLRAFWTLLLGYSTLAFVCYLLSGAIALGLAVRLWRPSVSLESRYSGLLLATVLAAPHVGIYDLVVLAPAYLLTGSLSERSGESVRRGFRVLLYFAYVVPLAGPLAAITRAQASVPVFVAWLLALNQAAGRTPTRTGEAFGVLNWTRMRGSGPDA